MGPGGRTDLIGRGPVRVHVHAVPFSKKGRTSAMS
jgi:hypothetical protein